MIERPAPLPTQQVDQYQAEQQANESHAPGIPDRRDHLSQQNRAIADAAGQQGFQRVSLALSGDGIANIAKNDGERNPENHKQRDGGEFKPLQPELQWEIDTQNADQQGGAYQCPPPSLEEQVFRFFPHHGQEITHVFSSSINVKNTSSRLALPRRTSSTSAPACTSKRTSGPILLSPRNSMSR